MSTEDLSADASAASANRTGMYLAVLQLVFTLGWTTYVIYLPKLAAEVGIAPSESVSRLQQGLQSFLSMRRMEASFKNARALRFKFSQSLARRRQRLSQAIVRSTIQRLGNCTNPLA